MVEDTYIAYPLQSFKNEIIAHTSNCEPLDQLIDLLEGELSFDGHHLHVGILESYNLACIYSIRV